MCNRERSKGRKFDESGIKTNVCLLAAEFVSFKIDHPCLKTDTFSIPESKFTTMNFRTHYKVVRLLYAIIIISLTCLGFVK